MRRKPGTLLPLEVSLLQAAVELRALGKPDFHGYQVAKQVRGHEAGRLLTAHGTLYKALERLETAGFLASRWEDPAAAAQEQRLRRRFYRVTAAGAAALVAGGASDAAEPAVGQPNRAGLQPS